MPQWVDVLGDGNCFYRALYRAACNQRLLDRVRSAVLGDETCPSGQEDDKTREQLEDDFVRCFRRGLATRVSREPLPKVQTFVDTYRQSDDDTKGFYRTSPDYGSTFKDFDTALDMGAKVRENLNRDLRTNGAYVTQPIIEIVKDLLRSEKITLDIWSEGKLNSNGNRFPEFVRDRLILYIVGEHYLYLAYTEEEQRPARGPSSAWAVGSARDPGQRQPAQQQRDRRGPALDAPLVTDPQTIAMYVLKAVHIGGAVLGVAIARRIFEQRYFKEVFTQRDAPPPLRMLVIMAVLGTAIADVAIAVIVAFLGLVDLGPLDVVFDRTLALTFVKDALISMAGVAAVGLVIAGTMERKAYFHYADDGLRAVRALSDVITWLTVIFACIPFFIWT